MPEFVCIRTYRDRFEAEHAKSILDGEGIPALVAATDAGGWLPYLDLGLGGVRLLVRREDAETASELLREVFEEGEPAG